MVLGLARSTADYSLRARQGNLNPSEVIDSTFTITNPGIFGSLFGMGIINQPNVGLLSVGSIHKRPVVKETEFGDVVVVRSMVYLTLAYDHRLIDGAYGTQFLSKVKELLEANLEASRNQFIKDISILIKEGQNIISLSEEWSKDSLPFTLKLEWMSNLMMDAIRFQNTKEQKNLMKDTSNISMYLGERTNFNILYDLLISTNSLWSVFTDGTNLKSEYQLQKLFIDWESKLGLSVR